MATTPVGRRLDALASGGRRRLNPIRLAPLLLVALVGAAAPDPAAGQDEIAVGVVAGTVAGTWWALSLQALKSRRGEVLLRRSDVAHAFLPMIALGLASGSATGIWAEDRIFDAIGWGSVGWAGGFGAGYLIGDAVWEDDSGPWAGAVIGSGFGLALGAVLGAVTTDSEGPAPPRERQALLTFTHSIRLGR